MRYISFVRCFHYLSIFLSIHYVALIPACASDFSCSSVYENYDDAFLTRMANASGTIKALYEAGKSQELVEYCFALKKDIEKHCNIKICIEEAIEQMFLSFEEQGFSFSREEIDDLKLAFKMYEQKIWEDARCFFNEKEKENGFLELLQGCNTKVKNAQKHEVYEGMPTDLIVGVTGFLCGLFIAAVPFPPTQAYGYGMMTIFGGMVLNSVCRENDARNHPDLASIKF